MAEDSRLIIVSNRLPFSVQHEGDRVVLSPAAGGLATGLRGVHERGESVWIGWPGDLRALPRAQRAQVLAQFEQHRIVPVAVSRTESKAYYDGVCNGVLWPLFHYQIDRIPTASAEWTVYREVNQRFAAAIVREYRAGDVVWIHDYHLLLVPRLVREQLPDAPIGFFLHIPFPAVEVFRVAPWRREILGGMLGASMIGFHTAAYASHFTEAVRSLTAFEQADRQVIANSGRVRVGVHPMGVDAEAFSRLAADPDVQRERHQIRRPDQQLLLGIDRLDYTKGIPRRLLAYERLLQERPALRGRVRLIQVAVPSRDGVPSYQRFRQEIDELVGRINGEHGTVDWTPIRYLHQSVGREQLVALYNAADVMLVTPLRDGMNLVAKEFIASRIDGDGVLVLSEFAGAAAELPEALSVNPYAIDEMTATMERALTMKALERRRRMAALRDRVAVHDVNWWTATFLSELWSAAGQPWRPDTAIALAI